MEIFSQYRICGVILAWIVSAFIAQRSFVQLLDLEIQDHREYWERDGKPYVWLSQAPRSAYKSRAERWITAPLRTIVCTAAWLFLTPKWISADPGAKTIHRRYRAALLIFLTILVFWIGMLFLMAMAIGHEV